MDPSPTGVNQIGNVDLNSPAKNLESLLPLLELSPKAAPHVKRFRELKATGNIGLEPLAKNVLAELPEHLRFNPLTGNTIRALYWPEKSRIYVDSTQSTGLLLRGLVHELIHMGSETTRKAFEQQKNGQDHRKMLRAAERGYYHLAVQTKTGRSTGF